MSTGRSEFVTMQVERCPLTCLESVCFPNVKSFTFFTLELVYQVGGFAVGKGDDGISEAGVGAGERLGRDLYIGVGI